MVEAGLAVLKVIFAASTGFVLFGLSKRVWQKVLSFFAAILLAHVAYFAAGSIALSYHWIVLPDFLVNLFMPGFAFWGAVAGASLAYSRALLSRRANPDTRKINLGH
jgi:hypothetical protein